MGTRETKAIQAVLDIFAHIPAYSGIFRDNQAYSGIIQPYPGIFRTLCNTGIFRTLAYSEPETHLELSYIQNPGIFRTRGIFRTLVYSEPWVYSQPYQTSRVDQFLKIAKAYNYFRRLELFSKFISFPTLRNKYHDFF